MTRNALLIAGGLAAIGLVSPLSAQVQRPVLAPGTHSNAVPKAGTDSIVTTDMNLLTPQQLVQTLLGSGVTASNIVLHGSPVAAGTFQGGLPIIGLDNGIMLSSGDINSVPGPNTSDWTSTSNLMPGDIDLDGLTTSTTFDASTLEFDFVCATGGQVSFQYVFSSEEYNEWVNSPYNDVFGFFLNGVNIATLPGGTSVAINNINCGNPYSSSAGGNCGLYHNNSCADLPIGAFPCNGPFDTEMDGLTVVLTATGTLLPGTNHIKLAVADAGDDVYDSNVFIRGQSFTCGGSGAFFVAPTPCGQTFQALVGVPLTVQVAASAATGLPANAVTLTAGTLPAGLTHTPSLPLSLAGQNVTATTTMTWTPTAAQVGPHTIVYTATDQLGQFSTCTLTVNVLPVGSGSASATVVGIGCTPSGQYAELRSDPPLIGTTVDIEVRHALPNWFVLHMASFGPPVHIPLWSWCTAYVDVTRMLTMSTDVTDALGRSTTPFTIPPDPSLVGFDFTAQGVFLFTPDPIGIRATDGLYLVVGN
ncbi:MAG TPA: choice-of-anchor L domain-containing protein [Planctomycetota bacterium]|nr:choice-of-anchor L domain-containing protein [Planctomycetota bacterium]